ncbi:MAG: HupE/UreJ family protein [Actinobacteria bacterium]|nr:HupE/UreJ family protein [Actinomycetota bacterium]
MFGLDDRIAAFSDGGSVLIVLAVAVLLGLRHATDPDHIAAVTTLVAGGRERAARRAGELGFAWGLGHALTLFAFGLPILFLDQYLPERVQQGAETAIALVIVYLAVRLLVRWRRGEFRMHPHPHAHGSRTRLGAFGIGLMHGMGGSAGVGVLIVASVESTAWAVVSLVLLAVFTAVSMGMLSTGFGRTLESRPVQAVFGAVAPALGVASLAFGLWYAGAAWELAPYPF